MNALQGITIIEIAERPAGEYTARLLADFVPPEVIPPLTAKHRRPS